MVGKRYGYLVIACLIMLVLGLIYAWSIFVVPLEASLDGIAQKLLLHSR